MNIFLLAAWNENLPADGMHSNISGGKIGSVEKKNVFWMRFCLLCEYIVIRFWSGNWLFGKDKNEENETMTVYVISIFRSSIPIDFG